jgi:chromosome segregation ATPase
VGGLDRQGALRQLVLEDRLVSQNLQQAPALATQEQLAELKSALERTHGQRAQCQAEHDKLKTSLDQLSAEHHGMVQRVLRHVAELDTQCDRLDSCEYYRPIEAFLEDLRGERTTASSLQRVVDRVRRRVDECVRATEEQKREPLKLYSSAV